MLSPINKRKIKYIKYLNIECISLYLNEKYILPVLFFYVALILFNAPLLLLCVFFKSSFLFLLYSFFYLLPTLFICIIGVLDFIKNESILSYFKKNRYEIEKILKESNTNIDYSLYSLKDLIEEIIRLKKDL